jgi:hypothetical protein
MVKTIEEYEKTGTEAEKALIAACRAGQECVLNGGKLPQEGAKDAPKVRADLIRLLAMEATSLHASGVYLEGAAIVGKLDLRFAKCLGRLALHRCWFDAPLRLEQAEMVQLSLIGSRFGRLICQGAKVKGDVFLRNVTVDCTVDLAGAYIGGQLSCSAATLTAGSNLALDGSRMTVIGSVFLNKVMVTGTVNLGSGLR